MIKIQSEDGRSGILRHVDKDSEHEGKLRHQICELFAIPLEKAAKLEIVNVPPIQSLDRIMVRNAAQLSHIDWYHCHVVLQRLERDGNSEQVMDALSGIVSKVLSMRHDEQKLSEMKLCDSVCSIFKANNCLQLLKFLHLTKRNRFLHLNNTKNLSFYEWMSLRLGMPMPVSSSEQDPDVSIPSQSIPPNISLPNNQLNIRVVSDDGRQFTTQISKDSVISSLIGTIYSHFLLSKVSSSDGNNHSKNIIIDWVCSDESQKCQSLCSESVQSMSLSEFGIEDRSLIVVRNIGHTKRLYHVLQTLDNLDTTDSYGKHFILKSIYNAILNVLEYPEHIASGIGAIPASILGKIGSRKVFLNLLKHLKIILKDDELVVEPISKADFAILSQVRGRLGLQFENIGREERISAKLMKIILLEEENQKKQDQKNYVNQTTTLRPLVKREEIMKEQQRESNYTSFIPACMLVGLLSVIIYQFIN